MSYQRVAFLGFGEAGPAFASHLLSRGTAVAAYDILSNDPVHADAQRIKTAALGAAVCASAADAAANAELIVSTVTADQTVAAAHAVAPHLTAGQHYLDLNSTSPMQKREAQTLIEARGAAFVEGVAMDTVPLRGHRVPLLLAGAGAATLAAELNALGLCAEAVGDEIGQASTIKMLRSVLIKGFEALFVEAMLAAGKAGVQQRVVASIQETLPGVDWQQLIGYHLGRVALHGKRRAAEMDAAADTVAALGIEPLMARATALRQRAVADLDVGGYAADDTGGAPSIEDFLSAVDTNVDAVAGGRS